MPERSPTHDVDEVDLALLDALHVNPRASFERLASALGISAVTAARRWQRLASTGRVWVSSVPGSQLGLVAAVYEIEARPGRAEAAGRYLAAIPQVGSVYLTAGGYDVHGLIFAANMRTLTELLFDRLPNTPDVLRARSHIGREWFSGVRWRLGAIDTGAEREVRDRTDPNREPGRGTLRSWARSACGTLDPDEHALYLALQYDGRARYRDLAHDLGTSEAQVRRRMTSMTKRGLLTFRTDFTRIEGGWPALLALWLRVPDEALETVGVEIGGWRETRICFSVVGAANLFVMAQLHRIGELSRLFARIRDLGHPVEVTDQRVVLRPLKSFGRLLDHAGHATGVVPVDPWAPVGDFLHSDPAE
ncbi:MAG TPA: AsnC family transcriptional regulator [Pseudonocardiaceae bacterium]|nr:AsnC family transcriptional regulator [Pseudonocardiaceae bacterium]